MISNNPNKFKWKIEKFSDLYSFPKYIKKGPDKKISIQRHNKKRLVYHFKLHENSA